MSALQAEKHTTIRANGETRACASESIFITFTNLRMPTCYYLVGHRTLYLLTQCQTKENLGGELLFRYRGSTPSLPLRRAHGGPALPVPVALAYCTQAGSATGSGTRVNLKTLDWQCPALTATQRPPAGSAKCQQNASKMRP